MAVNLKGKGNQTTSVARGAEGADVYLKALRDGTLTVASWLAALSLEGRIFTANAGVATTAITFGDGGLATTEFDLHVAVPSSVAIIPLELTICFETIGTALLLECAMQSGSGSVVGANATAAVVRSSNLNSGLTSSCTIGSNADTGGTALATTIKEIWRAIDQLAIDIDTVAQIRVPYNYRWSAMTSGVLDVVGPSQQLVVFASSNAGTGQISLKYAELPSSAVE